MMDAEGLAIVDRGAELAYTTMVRQTEKGPWQPQWDWNKQPEKLRQDWRIVVLALMGVDPHDRPHRFRGEAMDLRGLFK